MEELNRRADVMHGLTVSEGWREMTLEIKKFIDQAYIDLRIKKGDEAERIKGRLDAYDDVLSLPEKIISRRDIFTGGK